MRDNIKIGSVIVMLLGFHTMTSCKETPVIHVEDIEVSWLRDLLLKEMEIIGKRTREPIDFTNYKTNYIYLTEGDIPPEFHSERLFDSVINVLKNYNPTIIVVGEEAYSLQFDVNSDRWRFDVLCAIEGGLSPNRIRVHCATLPKAL